MAYYSHRGGAALNECRQAMGHTIERLAALSREAFGEGEGVHISAISRIEKGRYEKPAFEDIAKIAWLLKVDLATVAEWYGLPAYGRTPEPAEHEVITRIKAAARGASPLDEVKLYERLKGALGYWLDEMKR